MSENSLCNTCANCECIFQTGVVRERCDFYKKKTQHKDEYHRAINDMLEIIDSDERIDVVKDEYDRGYANAYKNFRKAALALRGGVEQE